MLLFEAESKERPRTTTKTPKPHALKRYIPDVTRRIQMKSSFLPIALFLGVLLVLALLKASTKPAVEKPRRKRILTEREQAMYDRLNQALPHLHVMPQVAFSALITAKTRPARNTFDRKVADFVVCDDAFEVLAIIELDDRSHRGNEERDARRDRLLTDVGYRVIRYPQIPNVAKVCADFSTSRRE